MFDLIAAIVSGLVLVGAVWVFWPQGESVTSGD